MELLLPDGILELLPPLDPDEPPDEEEGEDGALGDEGMLEEDCSLTQPPTRNAATELTSVA